MAIIIVNFTVIQFAPGGPVEQTIAKIQGVGIDATARISGSGSGDSVVNKNQSQSAKKDGNASSVYRGARGLDPELIKEIERSFGFDKPVHERFILMIKNYLVFDFGESYFKDRRVVDLVIEKMPVSISLGLWTTLLVYLISIPLGMMKAIRYGSKFDIWTSTIIVVSYALPGFLIAIFLIIFFAGGSYLDWFPLRGLTSDNFHDLSLFGKIIDYMWHITLPLFSMVLAAFATTTLLTKN